jgi:Outer membrane protein beta-barrel domain
MRKILVALFILACGVSTLHAQGSFYAGGVGAISTLSADGQTHLTSTASAISLYKPENGPALNFFVGKHLNDYLSVQGNYVWNTNSFTMIETSSTSQGGFNMMQQTRNSSEKAFIGDLLLYFRNRRSWARPYLSVGTGVVHMASQMQQMTRAGSPKIPPLTFSSTGPALRVAVGIDLKTYRGWAFRYTFSETISGNPISAEMDPPGQRNLANFQNLFGFVRTF